MKKNIFLLCCVFLNIVSVCFWQNLSIQGNCDINDKKKIWSLGFSFNNVYPEQLVTVAQQHLNTYCCIKNKQQNCKNGNSDYYVDSPRLYDHLIDIGMRYIDWDTSLQYPNTSIDVKWKERRDFVSQYGDTVTGRIPKELQDKYQQYRGTMLEDFDIIESTKSCEERKSQIEEYNNNRNNISLAKKYFIICEISSCISDWTKNNRIKECQSLATQRILWERNYVQGLLLYQWTLALATNLEAYAIWHINHDKFSKLLEKIVMMSKWLWFINSKVSEMTKVCSV
jgi:hypothetical protein